MHVAKTAHVLALWAVVALLSLFEALLFPVSGAVCVATNVFLFLVALLFIAHAAGRRVSAASAAPAAYPACPLAFRERDAYTLLREPRPTPTPAQTARTRLSHVFLHVLCVAYVRIACWFELRALLA
jgi:hypothetical protein